VARTWSLHDRGLSSDQGEDVTGRTVELRVERGREPNIERFAAGVCGHVRRKREACAPVPRGGRGHGAVGAGGVAFEQKQVGVEIGVGYLSRSIRGRDLILGKWKN